MSYLKRGKIQAETECPWKNQCLIKQSGGCYHKGKEHVVDFSCGAARGFDIFKTKPDSEYITSLKKEI